MANDQDGQSRSRIQPLVDVATEGVELGYQALELVVAGLRESLRLQPASRHSATSAAALRARRRRESGSKVPGRAAAGGLAADAAAIAGELLKRAGAAAEEMSRALPKQSGQAEGAAPPSDLTATAPAGTTASTEFSIWNTSPSSLHHVKVSATSLLGVGVPNLGAPIKFDQDIVARIGPGKDARVKLSVEIPQDTPPGTYRALVQAEPPDTRATLHLTVTKAEAASP
jgi:hypothetical protein